MANLLDVSLILQEWNLDGKVFPAPIGEKILKHFSSYEDLEITFPGVPKGAKIQIPTWFLEMSKHYQSRLPPEQFKELVNYEKPEKFKETEMLKYHFQGPNQRWKLFGMGIDTVYFWGFWNLGDFSVRIGSTTDTSMFTVNVSRDVERGYEDLPRPIKKRRCRIVSAQIEGDATKTLRSLEEKMRAHRD